jgi:exodeoxyribonuclease V beta subunit
LGRGLERLTPEGLQAALKKNQQVDPPVVFRQFADLLLQIAQLPDVRSLSLMHAATQVAARMQVLKARTRTYGFADLLERLDRALAADAGPSAQRLRQRILRQYPAMLIDEFQDTSPRQLAIFDKLHDIATSAPETALLLIGDPKQAIYAFRGADIHSYLEARERTAGRHYVLDTNFRSTQTLVTAINGVFQRAEKRPGVGAFRFRTDTASNLPFVEVAAHGRDEWLVMGAVDDSPVAAGAVVEPPAITFCVDTQLRSMTDSCQHYAQLCAYRVATWLRDGLAGFVRGGTKIPLRPADIAVLVRTGKEAATVRRALHRLGIASVYLSERDSVFATPQATDLLRLMQAVVAPGDLRLVRAALATTLVGRSLGELFTLLHSEELLDAHCQQLQQLHHVWQARGVLSMVREALHAFDLPARCLAQEDGEGERCLTNVLQLAELLQVASAQFAGESALISWLATQVAAGEAESPAGGADDPQLLRLESDADLVKIVTVHKAKGLEYPLVLLPFASHFKRVTRGRTPFVMERTVVDGVPQRRVVLNPTAEQCAFADEDRLREDLRLLYVALTRAQHTLWVGAAAVKSGQKTECVWSRSALGFLISGNEPRTPAECLADLEQLATVTAGIEIETSAVAETRSVALTGRAVMPALPLAPALVYAAEFDRHWAVHSYSGIVRSAAEAAFTLVPVVEASRLRGLLSDEPTADEATHGTPPEQSARPTSAADTATPARHRFPAGAVAGDFLHRQLEWLATERFALGGQGTQAVAVGAELRRRCQLTDWREQADDTVELLAEVCQSPLPLGSGVGLSLSQLTTVLPELEFWLPGDGLVPAQLHAWCCAEVLSGLPRPALSAPGLHGMLKGIADLVFEHEGRYWVLDYKSNRLGADDAAYTQQALEQAMCQHRYDVQAVIYLLAVHRHLRHRLGARYQPATHLGGAAYVFLRGLQGPARGCVYLSPPLALLERLDAAMHSPP